MYVLSASHRRSLFHWNWLINALRLSLLCLACVLFLVLLVNILKLCLSVCLLVACISHFTSQLIYGCM